MKQVLQDLRSGDILVEDVPAAAVRPGHLLIQTTRSLISSGTERSVLEFGRAGYVAKATQQPDRVRQVFEKVRTDGLVPTVQAVRSKLGQPALMGYCNAGRVVAAGDDVEGFQVGDRVASNGHHAEFVLVPKHLCAKIPHSVDDETASFTVIGSIALHGIRLLQPTLGESVAVFGLGLVGLVAAQILQANGTRVLAFDPDRDRVALGQALGVEAVALSADADPVNAGLAFSNGIGVDAVLITASTQSHDLIHQAAMMSRRRGRIVLTGVIGLNLRRADFYEKELTFQVSSSYGPGRYDPAYEEEGHDYPIGFVRWTEQRNFEAVLDLMSQRKIRTEQLVSERVPISEAERAYDLVASKKVIGVVLDYPEPTATLATPNRTVVRQTARRGDQVTTAMIGAGGFAQAKLLPGLRRAGARIKWIASAGGVSAATTAKRFDAENSTTDIDAVLADADVDSVVIATRHDTHASLVVRALQAGKSVFVEKPLCLTSSELDEITRAHEAAASAGVILMVGFNRRFAPLVRSIHKKIANRRQPLALSFTCNAGTIAPDHWVHDAQVGGGRLLGEACHFVDLLHYLAGAPITTVAAVGMDTPTRDTAAIALTFGDGSIGHINYFANGTKRYPKELLDVYGEGHILRLVNFRKVETYGTAGLPRRSISQDKGHDDELRAFVRAVADGTGSPIPFESLANVTNATLGIVASIRESRVVQIA